MTVKELMEILSKLPPHCLIVEQRFDSLGKDFERFYRESDLVEVKSKSCCKFTLSNPSQLTN